MSDSLALVGLLVLLAVQWWISRAVVRHVPNRLAPLARACACVFSAAVAIGYLPIVPSVGGHLVQYGSAPAAVAAAALAYTLAASMAIPVYSGVRAIQKRIDAHADQGRRRFLHAAGGLAMASPIVALGYGAFIERTDFRVREIDVPLPQLPPDLDGLRIVHLSDIHLGAFLSERQLARVIDAANELRGHLAAVTGDLISVYGDPLDACIRQIARLRADAGVFGSMGNHERYTGVESRTARTAASLGVPFLRRQAKRLRFGAATLNLAGVDHQPMADRPAYLRGAQSLMAHGAFNMLLSHNPDVFPAAARQGWDLMLSGHTHGGQISVEILDQNICPARFITPYVYGLYRAGSSAAYVTRGIGSIGIPVRLGAPPEISLLRLRKA